MLIEQRQILEKLKEKIKELGECLDLEKRKQTIKELENELSNPDIWLNPEKASELNKKLSDLKEEVEEFENLIFELEELEAMIELSEEEGSEELLSEIESISKSIEEKVEDIEVRNLLGGEYDSQDAIVTINAGAGGTDACDWVSMLARMYTKWANDHGYEVRITDYLFGDEAGYRNIEMLIRGKYAYGYLKAERGVHRLIRISPFDFSGRRHTSFASVDVIPAVSHKIEVEINPDDLKIETFRASGPGGQHVNVTDSAVRITHLPTGITATCQEERSQAKNKEMALLILKSKLHKYYEEQQKRKLEELRGEKKEIAWGSQIRTYTMHAYNLVKDHRTGVEDPKVGEVLEGKIDHFIKAFLKMEAMKGVSNAG
ncbi:MAG: peptide chain release factor 2 [Actinobacteria bacterium]|nr:peptide chain release factor 2 [Actinomycetota bacterium]